MFVSNINDIKGIPVNMDSVKNVTKHVLVGKVGMVGSCVCLH